MQPDNLIVSHTSIELSLLCASGRHKQAAQIRQDVNAWWSEAEAAVGTKNAGSTPGPHAAHIAGDDARKMVWIVAIMLVLVLLACYVGSKARNLKVMDPDKKTQYSVVADDEGSSDVESGDTGGTDTPPSRRERSDVFTARRQRQRQANSRHHRGARVEQL